MRRLYLLFFLFMACVILLVTTTVKGWVLKRDLGFICSIFKEQGNLNIEESNIPAKSIDEIDAIVKSTIVSSAAKNLWHNSFIFEPEKRYSGFKESVVKQLEEDWDCKPMESYFSSLMKN